jgi:trk system potassium uptake protein TrkA
MRVIVSGAGAVGRHLAADLADRGHDVTLIDQDPDVVQKVEQWAPGVNVIHGDACEPWVLEQAEMAQAEVVVAATGDDEDNLVTSLLAKQEFAVPRVLARVNHPKNEWLFTSQWGVDAAVSPPHILTAMVEEAVTVGDLVRLLRLEGGRVSIVEMTLPEGSPTVGKPLYEVRLPADSAIVAVLRDGHVVIPQPETVLAAGDEVVALTAPVSESQLRTMVVGDVEGSPNHGGERGRQPSHGLDGAGSI